MIEHYRHCHLIDILNMLKVMHFNRHSPYVLGAEGKDRFMGLFRWEVYKGEKTRAPLLHRFLQDNMTLGCHNENANLSYQEM